MPAPQKIVTDNAPQLCKNEELRNFLRNKGVKVIRTTTQYNSRADKVERMNKILRETMNLVRETFQRSTLLDMYETVIEMINNRPLTLTLYPHIKKALGGKDELVTPFSLHYGLKPNLQPLINLENELEVESRVEYKMRWQQIMKDHDRILQEELEERNKPLAKNLEILQKGDLVFMINQTAHKEHLKFHRNLYELVEIQGARYIIAPLFGGSKILSCNAKHLKKYKYSEMLDLLPEKLKNLLGENMNPEDLKRSKELNPTARNKDRPKDFQDWKLLTVPTGMQLRNRLTPASLLSLPALSLPDSSLSHGTQRTETTLLGDLSSSSTTSSGSSSPPPSGRYPIYKGKLPSRDPTFLTPSHDSQMTLRDSQGGSVGTGEHQQTFDRSVITTLITDAKGMLREVPRKLKYLPPRKIKQIPFNTPGPTTEKIKRLNRTNTKTQKEIKQQRKAMLPTPQTTRMISTQPLPYRRRRNPFPLPIPRLEFSSSTTSGEGTTRPNPVAVEVEIHETPRTFSPVPPGYVPSVPMPRGRITPPPIHFNPDSSSSKSTSSSSHTGHPLAAVPATPGPAPRRVEPVRPPPVQINPDLIRNASSDSESSPTLPNQPYHQSDVSPVDQTLISSSNDSILGHIERPAPRQPPAPRTIEFADRRGQPLAIDNEGGQWNLSKRYEDKIPTPRKHVPFGETTHPNSAATSSSQSEGHQTEGPVSHSSFDENTNWALGQAELQILKAKLKQLERAFERKKRLREEREEREAKKKAATMQPPIVTTRSGRQSKPVQRFGHTPLPVQQPIQPVQPTQQVQQPSLSPAAQPLPDEDVSFHSAMSTSSSRRPSTQDASFASAESSIDQTSPRQQPQQIVPQGDLRQHPPQPSNPRLARTDQQPAKRIDHADRKSTR